MARPIRVLTVAPALLATALIGNSLSAQERSGVDYESVRPILAARCYECHGASRQQSGLRLDDRESVLVGGRNGPAVVIGRSADSLLIRRVTGADGLERMPRNRDPLTAAEIQTLRDWIDQGVDWPEGGTVRTQPHWAYTKPVRLPPPTVDEAAWPRNPIDAFILAELEARGIEPSGAAARETLLRRVSLDLIGLPPTLGEIEGFLTDREPWAFERVVDRLLGSHRFGERWARVWLDLARYADTKGYEKDDRRSIWRYRDWVIEAFNRDTGFDQFTIEQLAGDLLPEPSQDQLVATAFHRNTMTNDEGGTDDEEFRVAAVVDRANTTMQVWMGLTMGCAQCHDHKFDPFSQREYYQVFAFFNNTEDRDLPSDAPLMRAPTAAQVAKRTRLEGELATQNELLEAESPRLSAAQAGWESALLARVETHRDLDPRLGPWSVSEPFSAVDFRATYRTAFPPEERFTRGPDIDPGETLLGTGWTPRPDWEDGVVHTDLEGADTAHYLTRTITVRRPGSLGLSLGSDDGIKLWVNGREVLARRVNRGAAPDQERVEIQLHAGDNRLLMKIVNQGGVSGFYFEASPTAQAEDVLAAVALGADHRSRTQGERVRAVFRETALELEGVRARIAELRRSIDANAGSTVPIMAELPAEERRTTHVLGRGSFLDPREPVEPGVPEIFPPMDESMPPNRLGLARWLVHPDNPLTARVAVNRFWETLFGIGLVPLSEDFGVQGEPPSHPQLLDWLATEFVRQGWSVKKLLRLMVTSSTYRQASLARLDLVDIDPDNRLLAAAPSIRLEAEMIRDQALAVSGLLSATMFGPSVMPPQPPGVWQVVYSNDTWVTSEGEDRYRRGLYTFWRRTSPHPAMVVFDAPSREYCVVRRLRTNTPLQALVTLNDPEFVEAASALGRRVLAEAGPDAEARATYAFRLCLARKPSSRELDRLVQLYRTELLHYRGDPQAAEMMAGQFVNPGSSSVAEQAAWTVVANVLMNLDEFLVKY
jgi:hypothetical protein